jgi:hypothetical protein
LCSGLTASTVPLAKSALGSRALSDRPRSDNAAFASGGHRFSEVVSERNEGLNIDLNFSLLLLEVV